MLKTIPVPLDGSLLAERALPFAAGLAQELSTEVLLVRVSVDVNEVNPPRRIGSSARWRQARSCGYLI